MSYVATLRLHINFATPDDEDEREPAEAAVDMEVLGDVLEKVLDYSTAAEAIADGLDGSGAFGDLVVESTGFSLVGIEEDPE